MKRATLLIYAKPPYIGLAKTRLAKSLGKPVTARRIAMMSLALTLRSAQQGSWRTRLYTTPQRALSGRFAGHALPGIQRYDQGAGDLTQRLNKGLSEAPIGPVLFIGADAPDLTAGLIRQSLRALTRHDAVFGPARDGGFWLFGVHKTHHSLSMFENVRWSSPHAMADVARNLPDRMRIAYLPELIDIDEAEDWQAWSKARAD